MRIQILDHGIQNLFDPGSGMEKTSRIRNTANRLRKFFAIGEYRCCTSGFFILVPDPTFPRHSGSGSYPKIQAKSKIAHDCIESYY